MINFVKTSNKMDTTTPLKRTTVLKFDDYANISTGESMLSEMESGTTAKVVKDTNLVKIESDGYAVFSTDSIDELFRILNNSDVAHVLKMGRTVRVPLNVLYNYSIPHTHETLQVYLEIKSKSMFIKFIRRLMKKGILYQIKGLIRGEIRVIYMMNPFVCRRGNNFDKRILDVFSSFGSS